MKNYLSLKNLPIDWVGVRVDYIKIINKKNKPEPVLAIKKVISKRPVTVLVDKLHPLSFLPFNFDIIMRVPRHSIEDLLMAEE